MCTHRHIHTQHTQRHTDPLHKDRNTHFALTHACKPAVTRPPAMLPRVGVRPLPQNLCLASVRTKAAMKSRDISGSEVIGGLHQTWQARLAREQRERPRGGARSMVINDECLGLFRVQRHGAFTRCSVQMLAACDSLTRLVLGGLCIF